MFWINVAIAVSLLLAIVIAVVGSIAAYQKDKSIREGLTELESVEERLTALEEKVETILSNPWA